MSHTSTISAIKFVNLDALRAAIADLKAKGKPLTLKTGGTPRAYYSNQAGMGAADFVVEIGGGCPYDIGLYKSADGKSYEARTDFYGGHIAKVLGAPASEAKNAEQAKMGLLYQSYAIHAAMAQARAKGQTFRRQTQSDGTEKLIIQVA